MTKTMKRRFTDEFKREAVALWETNGRLHAEVASELGIMPTMLRRWQRKLQEGSALPYPAAKPLISSMTSSADQASEIAFLRRELGRARMERDILKNDRGFGPPVRGRNGPCYSAAKKGRGRSLTGGMIPR